MEKEQVKKNLIEYFTKNYSSKVDVKKMPLSGGLTSFLGIDSLHSLEILIDIESLFDIEITDELLSFNLIDNLEYMSETVSNLLCKTC